MTGTTTTALRFFFDLFRGLVLLEGAFALGMSLYIFRLIGVRNTSGKRLLRAKPWHLYMVVGSHLLALAFIGVEVIAKLGEPFSWRLLAAFVIYTLTLLGLFDMIRALRLRVESTVPSPDQVRESIHGETESAATHRKLDAALERSVKLEGKLNLAAGEEIPSAAIVTEITLEPPEETG